MQRRIIYLVVAAVAIGSFAYIVSLMQTPRIERVSSGVETGLSYSTVQSQKANRAVEESVSAPTVGGSASVQTTDRMIVKTGNLSLLVKNVSDTVKSVTEYVAANGGFVVTSYVSKEKDEPYGTLTVRLPAAKFSAGMEAGKSLGEVKSEQINGQDITEEFVDLEAQLKTLKVTETQLFQLMQRAGDISDILSVQRELTNVRSQIERLEGRLKYLKDSVAMSTITLHLSTDPENLPVFDEQGKTWKPVAVFKEAVRGLISILKFVGNAIIYFVVFIPLWIALALAVWLIKKVVTGVRDKIE